MIAWTGLFSGPPTADGAGSQQWRDVMLTLGPVPDGDAGYGGGLVLVLAEDLGEEVFALLRAGDRERLRRVRYADGRA